MVRKSGEPVTTAANLSSFGLDDGTPLLAPPPVSTEFTDDLQVLTTHAEVLQSTIAVASLAQRLISMVTPTMEPGLYDQPAFLDVLKRLVLGQRFARVRILLRDQSSMSSNHNQFVVMVRRLTGHVEVRRLTGVHREQQAGYFIADDRALVYRIRADRWEGVASLQSPLLARQYLQEFDRLWQACAPDMPARKAFR